MTNDESFLGGLAQLARAPALHAGGQRFESVILHQVRYEISDVRYETKTQVGLNTQISILKSNRTFFDILEEVIEKEKTTV